MNVENKAADNAARACNDASARKTDGMATGNCQSAKKEHCNDGMREAAGNVKEKGAKAGDKIKDVAGNVADKGADMLDGLADKVHGLADKLGHKG